MRRNRRLRRPRGVRGVLRQCGRCSGSWMISREVIRRECLKEVVEERDDGGEARVEEEEANEWSEEMEGLCVCRNWGIQSTFERDMIQGWWRPLNYD